MPVKQLTMDELRDIINKQYPFTNQQFDMWGNFFNLNMPSQPPPSNPPPETPFKYTYIETRY